MSSRLERALSLVSLWRGHLAMWEIFTSGSIHLLLRAPFVETTRNRRAAKRVAFLDFPNRRAHTASASLFEQMKGAEVAPLKNTGPRVQEFWAILANTKTGVRVGVRLELLLPKPLPQRRFGMEARVGIAHQSPFFGVICGVFLRKTHDPTSIGILRFEAVWYRFR